MGFDPVSGIGTGCWPGMKRLSAYLFDRFGGWDLGCFNPRSMAGGGPSLHAEGRAQDFAFNANDPDEMAAGDALFEWAVAHADEIGLQEILWRGFIWYYPRRDEGVRFPVQQADHMSHVHLGVDKNAGMNWDPSWVHDTPAPPPVIYPQEPDMFFISDGTRNAAVTEYSFFQVGPFNGVGFVSVDAATFDEIARQTREKSIAVRLV